MKKYVIAIEETITDKFEVEAENADTALKMAEGKYRNGEFVLCPGELQFKQMCIVQPECDATEWSKF